MRLTKSRPWRARPVILDKQFSRHFTQPPSKRLSLQPTVQCPKICSAQTKKRASDRQTAAVSCWPDAAPFTRFSPPPPPPPPGAQCAPSKKVTEFVALIEIPSSKRKEERGERRRRKVAISSESDFESELKQPSSFDTRRICAGRLRAVSVVTTPKQTEDAM